MTPDEFRVRAKECELQAARCNEPEAKRTYEELVKNWPADGASWRIK